MKTTRKLRLKLKLKWTGLKLKLKWMGNENYLHVQALTQIKVIMDRK